MIHQRTLNTLPRKELVRDLSRDACVPFDRSPRRACHFPMRSAVAQISYLKDVSHEEWEVFVIGPKPVDPVDRSINVDRLLNIDGAAPPADSEKPPQFHVGQPAKQQASTEGGETDAHRVTAT